MNDRDAWQWLADREHRDPLWASTEEDVRRTAVEAQRRLYTPGGPSQISMAIMRPDPSGPLGRSWTEIVFHRHMFTRVGGLEELLLFEEIIRRHMRGDRNG